jgi:hypothetical protein
MFETDYGTFDRAFRRVCGAFRLKVTEVEQTDLSRTYFRLLEPYPLDRVLTVGKRLLETQRKFPAIADWLAACDHGLTVVPPDRRQFTVSEIDLHDRAERLRYQDEPCGCLECYEFGVQDVPRRFVPTVTGGVEERAFHPRKNAVVIVGHWAHGAELRRWVDAREAFFAGCRSVHPRLRRLRRFHSVEDVVVAILHPRATREPGEEG